MVESRDLVATETIEVAPVQVVQRSFQTTTSIEVKDMTTEARHAYVEMADKQFAAPAREKTKQVSVETAGKVVLSALISGVAWASGIRGGDMVLVLIALTAVFGGKYLLDSVKKKAE